MQQPNTSYDRRNGRMTTGVVTKARVPFWKAERILFLAVFALILLVILVFFL